MTLWNLLGGALLVGAALAVVLGHDYEQTIHDGSTSPIFREKDSSDARQADFAAPPVAESQTNQSALTPQTTDAQQADFAAPYAGEPQNVGPASAKQSAEIAAVPAQQEDLAEESVADPQDTESASEHRWTETAAIAAQEPDSPKSVTAKPKKMKHKSAPKRRLVQRKHRYVTFFPERQNYHYGFPAVSN